MPSKTALEDPRIDAYIAAQPAAQKAVLREARALLRNAVKLDARMDA